MKRQRAFVWLASGLALTLVLFAFVLKSRAWASDLKNHAPAARAQRSDAVSGRGFPFAASLASPGIFEFHRNLVSARLQDQSRLDVPPTTKPGRQASPQVVTAAPSNDDCANAIAIAACPFTDTKDTTMATDEAGEPASTCSTQGNSVWYTLPASATARSITVDTCGSVPVDTVLMVYHVTGAACGFGQFVAVACNDDFCGDGLQSGVSFVADPGQTYKIQVGGFDGDAGLITTNVACVEFACDSILINGTLGSGDPSFTGTQVSGNLVGRLNRNGISSTCAAPKICAIFDLVSNRAFDAYSIPNESGNDACVTVNLTAPADTVCNMQSNAYLGTFNPASICTNYLADPGLSLGVPPSLTSFSCVVPAGQTLTVVVMTVNAGETGCGYTLTILGDLCSEPCTIACPSNVTVNGSPSQCAAAIDYPPPTVTGSCGPVICAPPSGSEFPTGTTTVSCNTLGGPGCSFSVTVLDGTPPSISCSTGVTAPLPAGQLSAVVNYPVATAADNCSGVSVVCVPPSGSTFPAGATLVACTATDASENASRCFFFVTLIDAEPPVIKCPANVSASLPGGQTSVVVSYPPATATDNFPGVNVACSPASGSSFPAGATIVTCIATDAGGNRAACSFIVGVGAPQAKVAIPENKPAVEFAAAPTRKPPKPKKTPPAFFSIENIGFTPLILTFDSIARTGSDVDGGRITDPNDTRFLSLNLVNADQSLTQLDPGAVLTLQAGQVQNLCAKFAAFIPALAGKTTGLAAGDVLPDTLTSRIIFRQNAGANIAIPILARVSTELVLVNISNPRALPEILLKRSGNVFTVSYAVFDSNLDVSRAKYEFLDKGGHVIAGPFEIPLSATLSSANLIRGQSFGVEQRFTGASSHPEIVSVRLTVFDGETSVGASASAAPATSQVTGQRVNRATMHPLDVKLR